MKKIIMLIVTLLGAMTTSAQIATLSHEGQISAFYGENSLIEAMNAATHGDIISLSSGRFNATNITKRVTLRGTGMSSSSDPEDMHEATVIVGNCNINVPDTLSETLNMESLYFINDIKTTIGSYCLKKAQFTKCRFNSFGYGPNAVGFKQVDVSFTHCRFSYFVANNNSQITFMNCIINKPYIYSGYTNYNNCFVRIENYYSNESENRRFKNCIIHLCGNNSAYLTSNTMASNCIGVCGSSTMFDKMTTGNTTNTYVSDITMVFKTFSNTGTKEITDSEVFELTETAAQTYLGDDGTQVGIYGGVLPYDERPLNPKITKCNVASKTTADGKLSVDIEVSAAGY